MFKIVFPLMAIAVAACQSPQQASQAALQGTWRWDKSRSDALLQRDGQPLPGAELTLVIKDGSWSRIHITRSVTSVFGRTEREIVYATDGRQTENLSPERRKVRATARWDQGRMIVEASQMLDSPGGQTEVRTTETWSLSPDGRTLTRESKSVGDGLADVDRREVFHRES